MTDQGELFEARVARDEAIQRVDFHAETEWKERAIRALHEVAKTQGRLTSFDLLRYVDSPREPRAFGPIMLRGQRLGWIIPTHDFKPYPRKTRHAAPARIWQSTIHDGHNPGAGMA